MVLGRTIASIDSGHVSQVYATDLATRLQLPSRRPTVGPEGESETGDGLTVRCGNR
jgi:hypothetical protein